MPEPFPKPATCDKNGCDEPPEDGLIILGRLGVYLCRRHREEVIG